MSIQKSEAHANPAVIAGAGAALTALAAELGISETALMFGIGACAVGATGLAWYNATGTDTTLAPAPGFKPWDDLTPEEKSAWGSNDAGNSWPENYQKNAIAWWALQYGLLDQDPNGNLEPTPEPDDNEDKEKWQKARNVLIALAAGGGAVAFEDAVGPLVDNAAATIKDMLFGGVNSEPVGGSLDLQYSASYQIQEGMPDITFATIYGRQFELNGVTNGFTTNSWYCYGKYNGNVNSSINGVFALKNNVINDRTFTTADVGDPSAHYNSQSNVTAWCFQVTNGEFDGTWSSLSASNINVPWRNAENYVPVVYLNANYGGRYYFPNDIYYAEGKLYGADPKEVSYGQFYDTPSQITNNIFYDFPQDYYEAITQYANDVPDNYKRTVSIPANISEPGYVPSYKDFVGITPDEYVSAVPANKQLQGSGTQTPTNLKYQKEYGKTVGQLLTQPLENLFPFCLITDLYRLTQMIEESIYPSDGLSTQDINIVNGTSAIVIPLDDFGVEGLEDLELDLTPVIGFGNLIRPWTTAIFIVYLLVGSFRFFLNRGGE